MEDKENIRARVRAKEFVESNGKVMRAINFIRHGYNKLTVVKMAAQELDVNEDQFLDSINFLALAGYIQLRTIREHALVPNFADCRWDTLETMYTDKGIRLAQGDIHDNMVEV
jgi:hypothetical protein